MLGRHSIVNVLGAVAVALEVGRSLPELVGPIRRLEAVEHRHHRERRQLGEGRPVVMVHGLWSSPITWMEMYNDLRSDPQVRQSWQRFIDVSLSHCDDIYRNFDAETDACSPLSSDGVPPPK